MHERSRTRLIVWTALLLFPWSLFAQDAPRFEDWFDGWFEGQVEPDGYDAQENLIEELGLLEYYERLSELAGDGQLCGPVTAAEMEMVRRFDKALDHALPVGELESRAEPTVTLSNELTRKVNAIPADLFRVETPQTSPDYLLFRGHPNMQVQVQPDETSRVPPCLWIRALVLNKATLDAKGGIRGLNIEAIRAADARWNNFLKNVTNDQFPWETVINGWVYKGTLRTPPRKQLRILHPEPAVVSPVEGVFTVKPSLVVQAIGIQRYSEEEYEPRFGATAIVLPRTETNLSTGWGAMVTYKKWSAGVLVRDVGDDTDVVHAVLGIELAQLLKRKKNDLARVREEWLSDLKSKIGDGS